MDAKSVAKVEVWYEDRVVDTVDYSDVPQDGVQAVVVHHADGTRQVQYGDDFYFTAEGPAGRIYGHTSDRADVDDDRYRGLRVLRGRWTDPETYHRIVADVMEGG